VITAVAHNTLYKAGHVVWCGVVGYASGLRDVAPQHQLSKKEEKSSKKG